MYVLSTGACSLPNSATPMPQSAIDAQDAYIARVGRRFDDGNADMAALISSMGGNAVSASSGDAGVASSGPTPGGQPFGAPGSSSPSGPGFLFGGGPGGGGQPLGVPEALKAARLSLGSRYKRNGTVACTPPTVEPVVTVFPIPLFSQPAPVASSPRPTKPAPVAAAPFLAPAPELRSGACWDKPAGVDVWVPGPGGWTPVGTPSTGPRCWTPIGVSGVFDASNSGAGVLWGSIGAGLFLLWAFSPLNRSKKRI